jgi:predicted PolB exonuclease-like 3'-5' exonuclease
MSLLVFDIESRVDKALLRATQFAAQAISDDEAYERMRDQLRHETGGRSDFFPVTYHVPISIALVSAADDGSLRAVTVLGADQLGEEGLVREFWRRLEAFDGTLVSFNGRGFDLPVLELQALRYGCALPRYFDRNGLRQRFGRHLDLQDWMANFGAARLRGGLNLIAKLIGLPGKGEVGGADVQRLWERGRWTDIHRYCADDAVQTYFVMLRVEQLRGRLTAAQVASLTAAARAKLVRSGGLQPATPGQTAPSVAG